MPRPVSMRASYRDDASYLLRLEAAVLRDSSQSEGWRKETALMTRQLALRLLEVDKDKTMFVGSGAGSLPISLTPPMRNARKASVAKRAAR